MIFGWGKKERQPTLSIEIERNSIHTVKFDPKRVTKTVKADLRENIKAIADIPLSRRQNVYDAVIIGSFGNLHLIVGEIEKIPGVARRRAVEIARLLTGKADALMRIERHLKLGIEEAIWRYPRSPCGDAEQDAAHEAADGKRYSLREGLLVNGKRTFPGREDHCKCIGRPVIPGINE